MKSIRLLLASFSIVFISQFSFAQDLETAMVQLNFPFSQSYFKYILEEESRMAESIKITKVASFRANADYVNLNEYLSEQLRFPDEARMLGVSGEVKVAFDILPDGKIANIEVLESPLELFSDQLTTLLTSMPHWNPAFQNGVAVKSRQRIHVNFRLP